MTILPTKSLMFAIYPDESLELTADINTEELIVHLGDPPAQIELRSFSLRYDQLTLRGDGSFHMLRNGQLVRAFHGPSGN